MGYQVQMEKLAGLTETSTQILADCILAFRITQYEIPPSGHDICRTKPMAPHGQEVHPAVLI